MSSTIPHWTSALRLHTNQYRTVGVAASFKTLRNHVEPPCLQLGQASPADFSVSVSLCTCPLGLCGTGQEAVPQTGTD